ncbi:hypothetical protein BgiMline_017432, partial [Biomphalaria glabrata]
MPPFETASQFKILSGVLVRTNKLIDVSPCGEASEAKGVSVFEKSRASKLRQLINGQSLRSIFYLPRVSMIIEGHFHCGQVAVTYALYEVVG